MPRYSNHVVLVVDWGREGLRHLRLVGYMGWVLLDEVLRDSDVLNYWLRLASLLRRGLNQLRAHELVFKGLLILTHSTEQHLDILLEASKHDDKDKEWEDEHIIDSLADTLLSNRFVDSWHPVDVVLNWHLPIRWAGSSLKFERWGRRDLSWLNNRVILVEDLFLSIHVVHAMVMRLQLWLLSMVFLMRMVCDHIL